MVDVAITNTYIMYKETNPSAQQSQCIKSFHLAVAEGMIGTYASKKKPGRTSTKTTTPTTMLHFPVKGNLNPDKDGRKNRYACHLCKQNKRRTDTTRRCEECKVWLCHTGNKDTIVRYTHYHLVFSFIEQDGWLHLLDRGCFSNCIVVLLLPRSPSCESRTNKKRTELVTNKMAEL